jgi:DNA-binding GntR family transcriptional regulator
MKDIPKYLEIEAYFIDKIENKEFDHGYKIPSEDELCKLFNTSRMTVNKALTRLREKKYITRTPRKGSFVSLERHKKMASDHTKSLTQDIINFGMVPSIKVIEYRVIRACEHPSLAKMMELEDGDYIHYFIRLRYGDGKPFALSYTYLSAKVVPEINVKALEGSLNEYLQSKNITRSFLSSEFSATLPTAEQKKWLECDDIALLKYSLFWHTGDLLFEYTNHYFIGNLYSITNTLEIKKMDDEQIQLEKQELD